MLWHYHHMSSMLRFCCFELTITSVFERVELPAGSTGAGVATVGVGASLATPSIAHCTLIGI